MFQVSLVLILLHSLLFAFDSSSTKTDNYIDKIHKNISEKVEYFSVGADNFISGKINFISNSKKNENDINSTSVDELFQNQKFINETRKSFVKLSTYYQYNSIGENSLNTNITARVALNKSNKRLKLFIDNLNQNNPKDVINNNYDEDNKAEIGLSIIRDISKNTKSRYSLGIRSLYPFIRANFTYTKKINIWKIEPVQNFEYSTKDEFSEYTRLYLDTKIHNNLLFRAEFGRGTNSKTEGMNYDGAFHLFWTLESRTGLQFTQGFYGNTKYQYIVDVNTRETKRFSGINNYLTQLTFRKNIYRRWLFYELTPGVNFSKNNNFKANYSFSVRFDILFGEI